MINLSRNLKKLLAANKLSENELARQTGLPQQMINSLNSGKNKNPKLSSLLPIVNFFSISLSQLIGDENIKESSIPHFEWKDLNKNFSKSSITAKKFSVTDLPHAEPLFVLSMHDHSMEPRFPKKTSLIFDVEKKAKNASFVLVYCENIKKCVFRMLISKKNQLYIKALNPKHSDSKVKELSKNDLILAVLVQSKTNHGNEV